MKIRTSVVISSMCSGPTEACGALPVVAIEKAILAFEKSGPNCLLGEVGRVQSSKPWQASSRLRRGVSFGRLFGMDAVLKERDLSRVRLGTKS